MWISMKWAAAAFIVGGALGPACIGESVPCASDDFCHIGEAHGKCIAANGARWCASDDPGCASGTRWQASAGGGLAGTCVAAAPDLGADFAFADGAADLTADLAGSARDLADGAGDLADGARD